MSTHDIKSWPVNFKRLADGFTAEVRRNDRNYALGDFVHVVEYEPTAQRTTGRTLDFKVINVWPVQPAQDHVLLTYAQIVVIAPVQPPPRPPEPRVVPELVLWCKLVDQNRVMQIVEDERGEKHQVFGTGMAVRVISGHSAGQIEIYPGGFKKFVVSTCHHDFSAGLNCTHCNMPMSLA